MMAAIDPLQMGTSPTSPRTPIDWRGAQARRRAATVLVAACLLGSMAACKPESRNTYQPPPPPEVQVVRPVKANVTQYLQYTGITEAFETVEVRARVQGYLQKLNFKPGQDVHKGDLLFEIDERPFIAALDRAKAQAASARADLLGAENDAKVAAELAGKGAGSDIDRILKLAKRDAAVATVAASDAAVATAALDVEWCRVMSPIDGKIGKNAVDIGNVVSKDLTVLATIVNTKPIYVNVDASESDVLPIRRRNADLYEKGMIKPGMTAEGKYRTVEMGLVDQVGYPERGVIDYVEPSLNAVSGTIRVRTRFANENGFLLPGQFVRIRVPVDEISTVVVPEIAVQSDQTGRFVLVVTGEKNIVEPRRVRVGQTTDGMMSILDGLTPADQVITVGVQRCRPGAPVTPKPATPGGPATAGAGEKPADKPAEKPAEKSAEKPGENANKGDTKPK